MDAFVRKQFSDESSEDGRMEEIMQKYEFLDDEDEAEASHGQSRD